MVLNMYLSIITLNLNNINGLTKRHMVDERIRNDTHAALKRHISLRSKDTHGLKVKG